jgi:hypothetical protein
VKKLLRSSPRCPRDRIFDSLEKPTMSTKITDTLPNASATASPTFSRDATF